MQVNPLFMKPGKTINRLYKGVRNAKRFSYAMSGFNIAVGAFDARQKNLGLTIFSGLLGCWFLKSGKDLSELQDILKPYYQEIVERAKLIKAAKKHSVK